MDIELMENRTQTSKTFVDENGLHTLHSYMAPIHYLDDNKQWADIDLTIEPVSAWEFRNAVLKNTYRAYFFDETDTNNHLVSIEIIKEDGTQRWINFKLKNALPSTPVVEDNHFMFEGCFDGIDLEYVVTEDRFKENIILQKPVDMNEFVFTVKLGGVKIANDEDGNVVFRDEDDNSVLFRIDRPYMEDSTGARSEEVRYVVGNDGLFDTISVLVSDAEFLANATYPLVIDPTLNINNTDWTVDNYNMADRVGIGTQSFTGVQFYATSNLKCFGAFHAIDLDKYRARDKYVPVKVIYTLYMTSRSVGNKVYKITSPWGKDISTLPVLSNVLVTTETESTLGYVNYDVTPFFDESFYGLAFSPDGGIYSANGPAYGNVDTRPKILFQYYLGPALSFVDSKGYPISEPNGTILKYLDLGALTAGQTSVPAAAWLRNDTGRPITNLKISLPKPQIAPYVTVELSNSNNPFIGSDSITFNGTIDFKSTVPFYVRVSTTEYATQGGNITIRATADMT